MKNRLRSRKEQNKHQMLYRGMDRDDSHAGSVLLVYEEDVYTAVKNREWIKNGNGDVVKFDFTTSPFPFLDTLPYAEYVLHPQTYKGDPQPAAESREDRFPAGPDQFYDVCVKTDGGHCHDDQEFAQYLERVCHGCRQLEYGCYNRRKYEEQYKKRERFFQAESGAF